MRPASVATRAQTGKRVGHPIVELLAEPIHGLGGGIGGWREGPQDGHMHVGIGEPRQRISGGPRVHHPVSDDAVYRPMIGMRESDAQAAAHEASNAAVPRAMPLGIDQQRPFPAPDGLGRFRETFELLTRHAAALCDSRKLAQAHKRRNAGYATTVAGPSGDRGSRPVNQGYAEWDIQHRLMIHHDNAAPGGDRAAHVNANTAQDARHGHGCPTVQAQDAADHRIAARGKHAERRHDHQPVSQLHHHKGVRAEAGHKGAAARAPRQLPATAFPRRRLYGGARRVVVQMEGTI
jgi:hypothetical protein